MSTNTLGIYNPIFYAQEALTQLESVMGMAARVHRGFDAERRTFGKGETISIRRPSSFTAQNAPSSAQNLNTQTVDITLNNWKEVKFQLTDKELSFTQERIINDHIRPAAVALADNVDQALSSLVIDLPWQHTVASSTALAASDLTAVRKILFDNKVPLNDPMAMHIMLDGAMEAEALNLAAFTQSQGAGDAGVMAQMRGQLGMKYGMNIFANQNVQSFTAGALTDGSSDAAVTSNTAAGSTTVAVDATSLTGTVKIGDIVTFSGVTQKYVVLANATAASNAITLTVGVPGRGTGLLAALTADTAVTVTQTTGIGIGAAFHRNAFALATAPLSEIGNGAGAKIATITDPVTGLSLRSRIYYDGDNSAVNVALDILYGVKTLDANLGARLTNVN